MSDQSTRVLGAPSKPLTGVGGWLAFWVFQCFYVLVLISRVTAEKHSLIVVCQTIALATGVISAVLILRHKAIALYFVVATLAFRLFASGLIGYFDSQLHHMANPVRGIALLAFSVGANTTWFVYFRTSRRVHNTLGRNL